MVSVHDIASYILGKTGTIPAMKLQKLLYYSQAWSLVWEERPLFADRIEAWVYGPVVPAIYQIHRGQFEVSSWPQGNSQNLSPEDKATVDGVLSFYGDKSSQWLSDLTHMEMPWAHARKDQAPTERGNREISLASMAEYYGSLR